AAFSAAEDFFSVEEIAHRAVGDCTPTERPRDEAIARPLAQKAKLGSRPLRASLAHPYRRLLLRESSAVLERGRQLRTEERQTCVLAELRRVDIGAHRALVASFPLRITDLVTDRRVAPCFITIRAAL